MAEKKQKNQEQKEQQKKNTTKEKIDYKSELKNAQNELKNAQKMIKDLKEKNLSLEIELHKNIKDFHNKAKEFQVKAQKEVNKVKENLEKHNVELSKETKKYGAQKLVENLMQPLNNLNLAIQTGIRSTNESIKSYVTGFEMLYRQIISSLEDVGVTLIKPNIGDAYDPELHESINGIGHKISIVKSQGFKFHERVLQPAKVELK